jgi:flagellar biosynthesis component FlhA
MPKTTNTGRKQTGRPVVDTLWNWRAELLWGFAVVVLLFACINPMIVLGLLVAAATLIAAGWTVRKMADGAEREQEKLASSTHLRAAPATPRDSDKTSARTPWHRHRHHAA